MHKRAQLIFDSKAALESVFNRDWNLLIRPRENGSIDVKVSSAEEASTKCQEVHDNLLQYYVRKFAEEAARSEIVKILKSIRKIGYSDTYAGTATYHHEVEGIEDVARFLGKMHTADDPKHNCKLIKKVRICWRGDIPTERLDDILK
ncbi:MAG: hypothetical protein EBR02_08950, partial [Alphaproteobacteria bacterium]|nr:hypothetical protein [Alphaproteobacteria bacterium]